MKAIKKICLVILAAAGLLVMTGCHHLHHGGHSGHGGYHGNYGHHAPHGHFVPDHH